MESRSSLSLTRFRRSVFALFLVCCTFQMSQARADGEHLAPVLIPPASSGDMAVEPRAASDTERLSLAYMEGYVRDTGNILAAPVFWDGSDWLKAGIVAGLTGGLYLVDGNIRDFARRHQNPVADKFALVGNALGNPLFTLPPLGALYLYGHLADDSRLRRTSLLALESFGISAAFTQGIKFLAQRDRPSSGAPPNSWHGPGLNTAELSFCSGHTSSAFSIATVIAEEYRDSALIPPIAYSLATLTGLSRIYSNAHWASDALFGAAVGYFVGKAVVRFHDANAARKLTITPQVGRDYNGVILNCSF